jgi:hypothetical protein
VIDFVVSPRSAGERILLARQLESVIVGPEAFGWTFLESVDVVSNDVILGSSASKFGRCRLGVNLCFPFAFRLAAAGWRRRGGF